MSQNGNHPQGGRWFGRKGMQGYDPAAQGGQNAMAGSGAGAQGGQVPVQGYSPAGQQNAAAGTGQGAGPGYQGYGQGMSQGYQGYGQGVSQGYQGYGQGMSQGYQGYGQGMSQGYQGYGQGMSQGYQGYGQGMSQGNQGYGQGVSQGYPGPGQGMPPGYQGYGQGMSQGMPAAGGNGSFIPQTPYSPGYTSPGYQPPQNGGYNPYGQMGRNPQPAGGQPNRADPSIPLNGGGYVPQKVAVRRRGFAMKEWYVLAAGAVLIALFAAGVLILKNTPLKIATIVLAAVSTLILWIRPLVAENRRLTYSILALAVTVLTVFSFLMSAPADVTNNSGSGQVSSGAAGSSSGSGTGSVPEIPSAQPSAATDTPAPQDNSLMERLIAFFSYWSTNQQDEMLSLCAPSWQAKQENPRTALFMLLANRKPKDCTPESITGTDADNSRRVTVTSTIDRNNGKDPEKYRMTILMVKENNEWYIDPQSLQTYEKEETPDPNVTATTAPTATPAVYPTTVLYYNPSGGEYYHADPNCRIINSKFLPLQGTFTYAEINNDPYRNLKPCNVCAAPLRDQ